MKTKPKIENVMLVAEFLEANNISIDALTYFDNKGELRFKVMTYVAKHNISLAEASECLNTLYHVAFS